MESPPTPAYLVQNVIEKEPYTSVRILLCKAPSTQRDVLETHPRCYVVSGPSFFYFIAE